MINYEWIYHSKSVGVAQKAGQKNQIDFFDPLFVPHLNPHLSLEPVPPPGSNNAKIIFPI